MSQGASTSTEHRAYLLATKIIASASQRRRTFEEAVAQDIPRMVDFLLTRQDEAAFRIELVEALHDASSSSSVATLLSQAQKILDLRNPPPKKPETGPSALPDQPTVTPGKASRKKATRKKSAG